MDVNFKDTPLYEARLDTCLKCANFLTGKRMFFEFEADIGEIFG